LGQKLYGGGDGSSVVTCAWDNQTRPTATPAARPAQQHQPRQPHQQQQQQQQPIRPLIQKQSLPPPRSLQGGGTTLTPAIAESDVGGGGHGDGRGGNGATGARSGLPRAAGLEAGDGLASSVAAGPAVSHDRDARKRLADAKQAEWKRKQAANQGVARPELAAAAALKPEAAPQMVALSTLPYLGKYGACCPGCSLLFSALGSLTEAEQMKHVTACFDCDDF
jgi:hypothetical protein